ncbi:MAG: hypothetical protein ACK49N_12210 [Verrucomicrobiota bacterium]
MGVSLFGGFAIHGYLTKPNDNGRYQIEVQNTPPVVAVLDTRTGKVWGTITTPMAYAERGEWFAYPLPKDSDLDPAEQPSIQAEQQSE